MPRPVRPRIHILEVSDPLLAYHKLIVRCGKELQNAYPKYMFSHDLRHEMIRPLDMCIDCLRAPAERLRYEYGLLEGQEQKDAERVERYVEVEEVA